LQPGQTVTFEIEHGPMVVVTPGESFAVNLRGHLRIPARIRRRCAITTRTQVLVVPGTARAASRINDGPPS